jgi:hypothetical protein
LFLHKVWLFKVVGMDFLALSRKYRNGNVY